MPTSSPSECRLGAAVLFFDFRTGKKLEMTGMRDTINAEGGDVDCARFENAACLAEKEPDQSHIAAAQALGAPVALHEISQLS